MTDDRANEWMNLPIKKVALVGGAPSRAEAPLMDPTWEIWGLGPRQLKLPRVTRWFEMHSKEQLIEYYDVVRGGYFGKHWTFLQRLRCPIYTQEVFDDLPNSVKYPLDEVMQDVGRCFTSSVSYMLGLAIHEQFEGIGMWGINMASKKEYKYQWPTVQYLLALARERGIHVYLPKDCPITIPKKPKPVVTKILYGYDWDHPDAWWNKRKKKRRTRKVKVKRRKAKPSGRAKVKKRHVRSSSHSHHRIGVAKSRPSAAKRRVSVRRIGAAWSRLSARGRKAIVRRGRTTSMRLRRVSRRWAVRKLRPRLGRRRLQVILNRSIARRPQTQGPQKASLERPSVGCQAHGAFARRHRGAFAI